jgi:hypothetical protein
MEEAACRRQTRDHHRELTLEMWKWIITGEIVGNNERLRLLDIGALVQMTMQ